MAAGRRALTGMMVLQHYSQLSSRPVCNMIMHNIRYVMRTHASETAFVAAHAVRFRYLLGPITSQLTAALCRVR